MAIVISGKSLRIVKTDAKTAADETLANGNVRLGRPVTVSGTRGTLTKWSGIPDEMYAAIVAETDPAKRSALLTNVTGKVLNGARVVITRDVWERFIAEHLAAVSADPENPTNVERIAARSRVQSFLTAGLVAMPDGETGGEDALGWAFGIADGDDDDDGDTDGTDPDGDDDDDDDESTATPTAKPTK